MTSNDATIIGRYQICGELAAGGMATIWIGHPVGSGRPVAVKRLPKQYASDLEFVTMFMDETWIATRVRHVNVVETLDVLNTNGELCLVMEYVEGETLARTIKASRSRGERIPLAIASAVVGGALEGLHAVHEARGDDGTPLHVVHRDVSPQNIMVGVDGVPRLLDFGVAKAAGRLHTTRTGQLKGKIAYMAPEQLDRNGITWLADVYAAGVVLWEVLAGRRLFEADSEGALVRQVLEGPQSLPSAHRPEVPKAADDVVARALAASPGDRWPSALVMARELERALPPARSSTVGDWVCGLTQTSLDKRAQWVRDSLAGARRPLSAGSVSSSTIRSRDPVASASSIPSAAPPSSASSLRSRSPIIAAGPDPAEPDRLAATTRGKSILVIDDSDVILANVRRALEAEGHRVTTTAQTVGAARFLVDCDLAIIDFHMPGIDGGSVMESFRAATRGSGRTCLFYLYTADPVVAREFARLGFDGAFSEKGDDAALQRQIRGALRMQKLREWRR